MEIWRSFMRQQLILWLAIKKGETFWKAFSQQNWRHWEVIICLNFLLLLTMSSVGCMGVVGVLKRMDKSTLWIKWKRLGAFYSGINGTSTVCGPARGTSTCQSPQPSKLENSILERMLSILFCTLHDSWFRASHGQPCRTPSLSKVHISHMCFTWTIWCLRVVMHCIAADVLWMCLKIMHFWSKTVFPALVKNELKWVLFKVKCVILTMLVLWQLNGLQLFPSYSAYDFEQESYTNWVL